MTRHMALATRLRGRDVAGLSAGLIATAATIAILRVVPRVSPTTDGLALLLVVLGTATLGRLWVATVVAVVATLGFNFYFFPPIGTFTIADPQNWVALIAFLVAAVIASNLSAVAAVSTAPRASIARFRICRFISRSVGSGSRSFTDRFEHAGANVERAVD